MQNNENGTKPRETDDTPDGRRVFPALLSLGLFLPHLTPKETQRQRVENIHIISAALFLLFSLSLFLCFLAPVILTNGETPHNIYQLLSDALSADPASTVLGAESAHSAAVMGTLVVILCCVASVAALFTLVCRWKDVLKKLNIVFLALPYAFALIALVVGIVFQTSVGALITTSEAGFAGTTVISVAAVALALFAALDLFSLYLLKTNGYYLNDKGREKLFKGAANINRIPAAGIAKLRSVLGILPRILYAVFSVLIVVLCFIPGSFLDQMNAANSVLETSQVADEIVAARGTVSYTTTMIVLAFLFLAIAVLSFVYAYFKREKGRSLLKTIPFVIYILCIIISLAGILPNVETSIYFAIFVPFVAVLLLATALECANLYLDNSFDFRACADQPNAYEKNEKIFHFNVLGDVAEVGEYALSDCPRLVSVVLADEVKKIGKSAFEACPRLTRAILGGGIEEIGEYAFLNNESLEEVILPATLKKIGEYAFANCAVLKDICFAGTRAEWNAVEKGEKWDRRIGSYCVHCSDGDISTGE